MKIAFFGDSLTAGVPGTSFFQLVRERLPNDALINYGKGGDTVVSLYHRLRKLPVERSDIVFLWIGVNDVLVRVSPTYRVLKILRGQPWAAGMASFVLHYERVMDWLKERSSLVLAVSPLLIGEDADNRWNQQLETMSRRIEELCCGRTNTRYVDLRRIFLSRLQEETASPYVPRSAWAMLKSALFPASFQDETPAARGLHYTVDGIHLNREGADLVAARFVKEILE
ncbi:MAG: SGNH/GDSL hydrolase family protein [Candidatus Aminicenantes bacterium]|nr:SGNH/GDSL hydrolase family protein [Candidatus Aminicenantes bacterium]